jgi:hypothetical protein
VTRKKIARSGFDGSQGLGDVESMERRWLEASFDAMGDSFRDERLGRREERAGAEESVADSLV